MSDADEIRKLYQLYTNALAERNFDKVGAMYTEDGMLMPPDQPPLVGPAQICKHYADSAGGDYEMSLDKIETSDKLAWVKGTAHWDEKGQHRYVVFVDVWRREEGVWRLAACIANSKEGFTQG